MTFKFTVNLDAPILYEEKSWVAYFVLLEDDFIRRNLYLSHAENDFLESLLGEKFLE